MPVSLGVLVSSFGDSPIGEYYDVMSSAYMWMNLYGEDMHRKGKEAISKSFRTESITK